MQPRASIPEARSGTGSEERTVLVRLAIPGGRVAGILFPGSNRIGTRLLAALIKTRLEAAGAGPVRDAGAGGLNEAVLMFRVVTLAGALRTVQNVLEEVGLLTWAQIAFHCPAELVNRIYYPPGTGRFDMPSSEQVRSMDGIVTVALRAFEEGGESKVHGEVE